MNSQYLPDDYQHISPAGVSIDIPLGVDFQYRSDDQDLVFICVTMPPWLGSEEASFVSKGAWEPN